MGGGVTVRTTHNALVCVRGAGGSGDLKGTPLRQEGTAMCQACTQRNGLTSWGGGRVVRALMETVEASNKNIEIAVMEQAGLRWV